MVVFHSYVSLPEVSSTKIQQTQSQAVYLEEAKHQWCPVATKQRNKWHVLHGSLKNRDEDGDLIVSCDISRQQGCFFDVYIFHLDTNVSLKETMTMILYNYNVLINDVNGWNH